MSMQRDPLGKRAVSISRLRTSILLALIVGVTIFTAVMFSLVQSLSERFGPEVAADLEWRALRGARELSYKADLGLAVGDTAMVQESFGVYASSHDVDAIVAVDEHGKVVAQHGSCPLVGVVFAAKPETLSYGPGYVASWAPSAIEGTEVGKLAVVVSTHRLADAEATLTNVENATLIAGLAGAILGALVILFFTRAVSVRDRQLGDYAKNLEAKVEARTHELDERNRGMRLVLDNVAQGFITIDLDGVMAAERSAIVDRWFGAIAPGDSLGAVIARHSERVSAWLELGLESVREGVLPLDLCLHQLPNRLDIGTQTFSLAYSPIANGDTVDRVLVIVSDITEQIVRERAEREQRELVVLFQRITADRSGFEEFVAEASALVASLAVPGDPLVEKRAIHTLKGNCAIYGLDSYAALCHAIESELEDQGGLVDVQRRRLDDAWREVIGQIRTLVGTARRDVVEVDTTDLARTIAQAKQSPGAHELVSVLTSWTREPVRRHFERLARHATGLAQRLGKGEVEIEMITDGIRLDEQRWSGFWTAMVHAVRNSVDHAFETAGEATSPPKLTFTAERAAGYLTITMADNGGGIAWDKVRERARAAGLPAASQADLEQALFADGLSTKERASETSGRGVGMAALRDAVVALGGSLSVDSSSRGTTLRFRFVDDIAPPRRSARPSQSLERAV